MSIIDLPLSMVRYDPVEPRERDEMGKVDWTNPVRTHDIEIAGQRCGNVVVWADLSIVQGSVFTKQICHYS
jgi:hypothetical protein